MIHLAQELDMKIIAEGVEEYEQYQFLIDKKCDYLQGYLFSKPIPAEVYEELLSVGIIKPNVISQPPVEERRNYYRFTFPYSILGSMTVSEVNNKKVNLGQTKILIRDISLGGMKIKSNLKLPMNANIKYKFTFTLLGERIELLGKVCWQNKGRGDTSFYGIEFELNQKEEDRLAPIMNKMSTLQRENKEVSGMEYIYEDMFLFFTKRADKV